LGAGILLFPFFERRVGVKHHKGEGMTELLYYTDAYCQNFDASVTAVETQEGKTRVALDRTAFYPGGGGQPNDEGQLTIAGKPYPVAKVNKEGGQLWHTLGQEAPDLSVGMTVQGQLNWERRYALMRTHTAMHILCGVVWRDYGASVTGGNMDPGSGRMDFEFASLTRNMISEIEAKCNAEVAAAHPVRAKILPREEAFQISDLIRTKINLLPEGIAEVRTVELVGLDLQADGGTHVRNTQEVGTIKVVDYKSKGAINKRVYIELG
jgi:misacylated tRNA(Ala) deacylase